MRWFERPAIVGTAFVFGVCANVLTAISIGYGVWIAKEPRLSITGVFDERRLEDFQRHYIEEYNYEESSIEDFNLRFASLDGFLVDRFHWSEEASRGVKNFRLSMLPDASGVVAKFGLATKSAADGQVGYVKGVLETVEFMPVRTRQSLLGENLPIGRGAVILEAPDEIAYDRFVIRDDLAFVKGYLLPEPDSHLTIKGRDLTIALEGPGLYVLRSQRVE